MDVTTIKRLEEVISDFLLNLTTSVKEPLWSFVISSETGCLAQFELIESIKDQCFERVIWHTPRKTSTASVAIPNWNRLCTASLHAKCEMEVTTMKTWPVVHNLFAR
jgi:hypothetical protein